MPRSYKEIEEETGAEFTGRIVNVRDKKAVKLKGKRALESDDFPKSSGNVFLPRTSYRVAFHTDAVVAGAIERIDKMEKIERAKFRLSRDVVAVDSSGVSGGGGIDLGTVESEADIKVPDVVRELCRRLPLSRATIVRILKGCVRLEDVLANPAVFIDQVADCMNRALYEELTKDTEYAPTGESWPASDFEIAIRKRPWRPGLFRCSEASQIWSSVTRRSRSSSPATSTVEMMFRSS